MNLKTKAFGLIAALGLSLSIVAPTLAADTNSNTGNVVVTLAESGTFAVSLTASTLLTPSGTVSATSTGITATGSMVVHYVDTKSFRYGFDTKLKADNFTSTVLIPFGGGATYGIPSSNLFITKNYDPGQCRWSSGVGFRIGDIGATTNGADADHNASGTYDWTGQLAANTNLGVQQLIHWGYSGPGTASSAICDGTNGLLDLTLNVPNNTPAATYTSIAHVDVVFSPSFP
jgi:hypothetical protein